MALQSKRLLFHKRNSENQLPHVSSDSMIAEQFRTIRTNMKFLPIEAKNRIILITSPEKGDGKSVLTANLAITMAQQNEKILLIDANLRDPMIHKIFNIRNVRGLADVLLNEANFNEVMYQAKIGNLDIITSGLFDKNPAELIESEQMANFLQEAIRTYNLILIDSPSILKATETRVLANQSDGVILVIHHRKTNISKVSESRKILELVDAKLVGAILNKK